MFGISISFGEVKYSTEREFKGNSILECLSDYVVIDLETTGLDPKFDEIIECAAVKVENGIITADFQSLIKPSFPIDGFITELTGITNEMLEVAPSIHSILPKFIEFIGDNVVVAHNANFDINFLYDACREVLPNNAFSNNFIDTMRFSRRLFKTERHHRLIDLVERFGIATEVEHRALSDVMKTKDCYEYIKKHIADNNIDLMQIIASPSHSGVKAGDIKTTNTKFDESTAIYENVFVFTGALQKMLRKDAMQLVVDLGGLCGDGVTAKTNYLVLGNNDYCSSIKDGKSSKQKKAEKYKADGLDIDIISENVFYEMITDAIGKNSQLANAEKVKDLVMPQDTELQLDTFEISCLRVVCDILNITKIRYAKTNGRLLFHTSFWSFLTISSIKKGYFVQPNWDFNLESLGDVLLTDQTKSVKRIFIGQPKDIYKLRDYITEKEKETQKSWEDYVESVAVASSKKRIREYEKSTKQFEIAG
jgi:DNA polymerase-3 subunit epsilon